MKWSSVGLDNSLQPHSVPVSQTPEPTTPPTPGSFVTPQFKSVSQAVGEHQESLGVTPGTAPAINLIEHEEANPVQPIVPAAEPVVPTVPELPALETATPTESLSSLPAEPPVEPPSITPPPEVTSAPPPPPRKPGHAKLILWSSITAFTILLIAAAIGIVLSFRAPAGDQTVSNQEVIKRYKVTGVALSDLANTTGITVDSGKDLTVNGQLNIGKGFVVATSDQPQDAVTGQFYLSNDASTFAYYNGVNFVNLVNGGQLNAVSNVANQSSVIANQANATALQAASQISALTNQLNLINNQLVGGLVLSVQGQTGNVQFNGGSGIVLNGTTIENTGVLSVTGTPNQIIVNGVGGNLDLSLPQDIATSSAPTFAGLTLGTALSVTNGGTGATTPAAARANLQAAQSGANADITSLTALSAITPTSTLTIGSTSQNLILQGSAASLSATSGGNTTTLSFAAPIANTTINLPSAAAGTYDVCITSGNCIGGSGGSAPANATYLTLSHDANLTAERVLTAGTNLSVVDSGANGSLTVNTVNNPVFSTSVTTPQLRLPNSSFTALVQPTTLTGNRTYTLPDASGTVAVSASGNIALDTSGNITFTGILPVASGGTGQLSFAANGVLYGNGGGALQNTLAPTSGQVLLGNGSGTPTFTTLNGDVAVNGSGVTTIQPDSVALGTDTTGAYVQSLSGGNGVSVSGSGGEGSIPTISLGPLTGDYNQTAPFDIVLNNASSELKILESSGATYYGSLDVGDLSSNQTYTFIEGGTVVTTGNISTSAVTGVTAGSGLTGGGGPGPVSLNIGAGTGVQVNTDSIDVLYGSAAGTAVQGDTQFTLNAGGNLTGGGTITLGAGGSLNVNIVNNPTFTTSITTPIAYLTNSGFTGALQPTTLTGNRSYSLPNQDGEVCLSTGNCAGLGSDITGTGTAGKIAKFDAAQNIVDSIISENAGKITIGGTLDITGASTVTLGTGSANNGSILFNNATNNNVLTLQSGATASNLSLTLPTADGGNGDCLMTDGSGVLSFGTCLSGGGGGSGGVTSLNGLSGVLSLANASGSGATVTINNASTSQKGIAQFNATNFTDSSGVINTVQDIATSSSPSFSGLSVTGPSGVTVGTSSNVGKATFGDGSTANTVSLQAATQTGSHTITIPNASGTMAISASGNISLNSQGNISFTGQLPVASGGTGTNALTPNGVLYGNGSSAIQATAAPTSGQVMVGNAGGVPTFVTFSNAIAVSGAGVVTVNNDAVTLGTQTTGDYVGTISGGNGISVTGSGGEGSTPAITLGPLTSDWNQTGAFDIVLNNSNSQMKILENGSSPQYFGKFDVADLTTSDKTYLFPDVPGSGATVCLDTGNCAGVGVTLQAVYGNSTNPELVLSASPGGLTIRDNATPISGNLFEIQNNTGSSTYLGVSTSGISVTGTTTTSGALTVSSGGANITGGIINNNGGITTAGAISGATSITASGTINTTAGVLQTNTITRVDNSGNLVNINNITAGGDASIGGNTTLTGNLNANGASTFKDSTNSSAAFQIQNANADTLFQVDTVGNNITIGGNNSGELQTWQTNANALPAARNNFTSVTANGYAYAIGGYNSGAQSTVYYAKLNADGSTAAWASTTTLPEATFLNSSAVVNGYIYVIGGSNGTVDRSTIYYAKLNTDGTVGTWSTNSNALPAIRSEAGTVVANGYLYVIGGANGTAQSTVYYAKLNADGSTGSWSTNSYGIGCATPGCGSPAARRQAGTVVANGYVYVIGGNVTGTAQSTVYYAKLNADGSTGSWSTNANSLTAGRYDLSSVVANGYVYAIGGYDGSNAQTTVYYARLNADGSTGVWATGANSLAAGRYGAGTLVANGYIYDLGGFNGSSSQSTVYYTSTQRIKVGGSLDLVGLSGANLANGETGTGGELTAGNTNIIGTLGVQGQANFAQGVSVAKELNVGGGANIGNARAIGFAAKADSTTGNNPALTATGDFNGDGKADLAVANFGSNTVSVYINTGSGLPATATSTLTAGSSPYGLVSGDFNADGKADLVVTNNGTTTALVYINTGTALPTTATSTLTTGSNPQGIVTGDFNADTKTDVAIANLSSNTVSVYINTGTALPTTATSTLTAGTGPTGLTTGDFNGDSKTDLVVINNISGSALVYINTGTALPATFTSALAVGSGAKFATTGDFNGDGKTDLVVANQTAGTAYVYTNTGIALPTTASSVLATGSGPFYPTTGDFNGDGKTDLVVPHRGSTTVGLFINTGTALPTTANGLLVAGAGPSGSSVADFNGDGKSDIAVTNTDTTTVSVFMNQTTVGLGITPKLTVSQDSTAVGVQLKVALGSQSNILEIVNADGTKLATIDSSGRQSLGTSSTGNGSFTSPSVLNTSVNPGYSTSGDFNGDGQPDLVTSNQNSNSINVFNGSSSGLSTIPGTTLTTSLNAPQGVASADFNGDGKADLLATNSGTTTAFLYINTGTTLPSSATTTLTGLSTPRSVAVGDFNADGKPDAAITNYNSGAGTTVTIFLNNGSGLPITGTTITTGTGSYDAVVADINGDNKDDLVVTNNATTTASVFINTGTALPTTGTTVTTGAGPQGLATGDFNADGKTDLVVVNATAATASVFINTGTALPTSSTSTLTTGATPRSVSIGDVNGDGKTDAFIGNSASGNSSGSLYINTGTALPTTATNTIATGNNIRSSVMVDFNNDNRKDIAFTNQADASVWVLYNNSFNSSRLSIASSSASESALTIQSDASTAFQVQSTGGQSLFTINASASQVTLGGTGTTPVLLVLGNKTSTADPTCVNGAMYYNSSTGTAGQAKICINNAWAAIGVPKVTSLPSTPSNGDEVYFDTGTSGVLWHLRYNSTSSKWEYLGGPALTQSVLTQECTAATTYGNLATAGPYVQLPLSGDYDVSVQSTAGVLSASMLSNSFSTDGTTTTNGTNAQDSDAATVYVNGSLVASGSTSSVRKAGLTATRYVTSMYKTSTGTQCWGNRIIKVTPVKVN